MSDEQWVSDTYTFSHWHAPHAFDLTHVAMQDGVGKTGWLADKGVYPSFENSPPYHTLAQSPAPSVLDAAVHSSHKEITRLCGKGHA